MIMAIDPICGMQVDEFSGFRTEKDGQTWYFCSEHCRAKFLGLPHPINHSPFPIPHSSYYCPMCPGVESDSPGACPKCGMALEPSVPSVSMGENAELVDMSRRLKIGAVFALPVFLLAMTHMVPAATRFVSPNVSSWIQFLLSAPVVLWAGRPLLERGWRSFRTRRLNMFSLISLGVATAFLYSVAAVLLPGLFPASFKHHGQPPAVYFEAAAMITVLVLLGQVLELRARSRTGDAIRALLRLAPDTAHQLRDGEEIEVPLDAIHPGDLLRVKPGDKVPVDGQLIEGRSFIDESMITGEPLPVEKINDSWVTAGTINGNGAFVMRAEKVGRDTLLARIVALVAEAQRSRAPIQRLADRVASVFVPIVIAIAAVTFLVWAIFGPEPRLAYALINAVSVLIIACPCALGLATPMSVMVGIGRGARAGILIRSAEALERLAKVDTVVVDKTGTLTEGHPSLTTCIALDPLSENQLLRIAGSVEHNSEHPLAAAIVTEAKNRGLQFPPAEAFQSFPGLGVSARVQGHHILMGNRAMLDQNRIADADCLRELSNRLERDGHTTIHVAMDGKLAGLLAVSDPVKASTPEAVDKLKRLGIRLILVTGDQPTTAETIARRLGIQEVHSRALPSDKARIVSELRASGRFVAMAGDGINDAPALATADVGIAMGTGTDVAIESAGVTLVKGDLRGIEKSIRLSRAVLRNIRQNLFFAFLYNSVGVPVAAGILYPLFGLLLSPILAGAAMSFSSVSVIANALRLRNLKL